MDKIKIKDINLDTAQPRQDFCQTDITDLANDIKRHGMLYPILVTPFYKNGNNLILGKKALRYPGRKYWLLDGERRVRAFRVNREDTIDADIKMDLDFYDMLEIQFSANTKRVQITVEEMAKAIERFKVEYYKKTPKGNHIKRLVELTGFSSTHIASAELIVQSTEELKSAINKGQVGGYLPKETNYIKDDAVKEAVNEFYIERGKKHKAPSVLLPRTLKPKIKKVEQMNVSDIEKKHLTTSILNDAVKVNSEEVDKKSDFPIYLFKAQEFLQQVEQWKIDDLTEKELGKLIGIVELIRNLFVERRRIIGKLMTNKRSKNIMGR